MYLVFTTNLATYNQKIESCAITACISVLHKYDTVDV